jgi:predicted enzyme related to lactoylglutathione lyase
MQFSSQITFLYFDDLKDATPFFEETLKLTKIDDQGFAKIYRISGGAFIGIVDASQGYCRAPTEQNTLITLVTDDVHQWYQHLKSRGVKIDASPKHQEKANVECFFFKGPGGYAFEVQKFLNPEIAVQF